ncbi:MAG: 16S rRNA (uracil(1498)-N(3))-methyltransferase [Clostridia bacterium]|nr:16S rRNA (uracil(1498)-N(3))-methyltransferase [Clostridia bacterium]
MFNFFAKDSARQDNRFYLDGSDHNHIKNVLRMQPNDTFLVSQGGASHLCRLVEFASEYTVAEIVKENYQNTELPVELYLFQGLPKSDKIEWIIQKTVELGVNQIVPVEMTNCVVKLEEKKKKAKQTRWQAIAEAAAKQSKRTIIPTIHEPIGYKNAIAFAQNMDIVLVPYENARVMAATKEALAQMKNGMKVGIFIGPEGGFDPKEIDAIVEQNGKTISLGSRILRTETAAITAVSLCMLHIEMNGDNQ